MAWLAYIIGILLMVGGAVGFGLIVFGIGMIFHYKFWLVGIIAFFVGAISGKILKTNT